MPRIITSDEKLAVLDDWLSGESRIDIAKKHNMGNGTVYNIVQEWSNGIGVQLADRLREIAVKLKQNGLTVSGCAKGLRMLTMLKKYEIEDDENEERVTYFLKEIYTKCQKEGLTPQKVFDYIGDILKFSNEVSISQIPKFIKQRIEEKEKLENEVQELFKKRDELLEIIEKTKDEIQGLRSIKETMTKTYTNFTIIKFQLNQYGIGMEDLDQFVKCVVGISKEGHNAVQVLAKIANYENLEKNLTDYNEELKRKKDELDKVNLEISAKEVSLSYFKIKIDLIDELQRMGFGNIELRSLITLLNEIGLENNLNFNEIRKQFFHDVKNYEEVIGSRKEIDRLKDELKNLEMKTIKEREKFIAYPPVIEAILRLAGSGINEDDILKIDKILMVTDYYPNKDKPMYKDTLIDELQKYGNLKLTIKKLEETANDLNSKIKTRGKQRNKKEKQKPYKKNNIL